MYANPRLQNNSKILKTAIENKYWSLEIIKEEEVYVIKALRKDPKVLLMTVRKNGLELQYTDPSFQKNLEIVLAAVSNNGLALEFASPSLQAKPSVVLAAVLNNGLALQFASPRLRDDQDIVLAAVKKMDTHLILLVKT